MTHPFASDITALDSKMRRETIEDERVALQHDMAQLKRGTNRWQAKRFIGRQIAVRSGTYKPPQPKWLKTALDRIEAKNRPVHLDAE
jgi:hypothetical protein